MNILINKIIIMTTFYEVDCPTFVIFSIKEKSPETELEKHHLEILNVRLERIDISKSITTEYADALKKDFLENYITFRDAQETKHNSVLTTFDDLYLYEAEYPVELDCEYEIIGEYIKASHESPEEHPEVRFSSIQFFGIEVKAEFEDDDDLNEWCMNHADDLRYEAIAERRFMDKFQ